MDQLPAELIDHLCLYLSPNSLKSLRATCKALAYLGEVHLFHEFEFVLYPSHHRLYQLERLARHPTIAPRLRCVALESGVQTDADYRCWQANIYQSISSDWSLGLASRGGSQKNYEAFHDSLQRRFTPDMPARYELYRWHQDQQAAMMAEPRIRDTLTRILNSLASHNQNFRLKLIMKEPSLSLEQLEAFNTTQYACETPKDHDPLRRVLNRRANCLKHFALFLAAIKYCTRRATHLRFLSVPHQFLSSLDSGLLTTTFSTLAHLEMKIGEFPHSDWLARGARSGFLAAVYFGGPNRAASRLTELLNCATNLSSLRLEFPEGKESEYSFDFFDRTNLTSTPRLWLHQLRILHLCRFRTTWENLKALLEAATNVKNLSLRHCRLETGSMVFLVCALPTMHLEHVSISGTWIVNEDEGEWHSHGPEDFTECRAATDYEGPYVVEGMRAQIERHCLRGGQCPLPRWTTDGQEERIWEMQGDTSWHYLPGLRSE